jgi:hypothetical protein
MASWHTVGRGKSLKQRQQTHCGRSMTRIDLDDDELSLDESPTPSISRTLSMDFSSFIPARDLCFSSASSSPRSLSPVPSLTSSSPRSVWSLSPSPSMIFSGPPDALPSLHLLRALQKLPCPSTMIYNEEDTYRCPRTATDSTYLALQERDWDRAVQHLRSNPADVLYRHVEDNATTTPSASSRLLVSSSFHESDCASSPQQSSPMDPNGSARADSKESTWASTPLHIACIYQAPDSLLRLILDCIEQMNDSGISTSTEILSQRDVNGWTPLHVRLLYPSYSDSTSSSCATATTRRMIVLGGPAVSRIRAPPSIGLPLHVACRHETLEGILPVLLEQYPEAIFQSSTYRQELQAGPAQDLATHWQDEQPRHTVPLNMWYHMQQRRVRLGRPRQAALPDAIDGDEFRHADGKQAKLQVYHLFFDTWRMLRDTKGAVAGNVESDVISFHFECAEQTDAWAVLLDRLSHGKPPSFLASPFAGNFIGQRCPVEDEVSDWYNEAPRREGYSNRSRSTPLHMACTYPLPDHLKVYTSAQAAISHLRNGPAGCVWLNPHHRPWYPAANKVDTLAADRRSEAKTQALSLSHVHPALSEQDPFHGLLSRCPLMASTSRLADSTAETNDYGRFPLHAALAHGCRSWHDGIGVLALTAPNVILLPDPITRLYPFQLAAMEDTEGADPCIPDGAGRGLARGCKDELTTVETTWELLLASPEVLRMQ